MLPISQFKLCVILLSLVTCHGECRPGFKQEGSTCYHIGTTLRNRNHAKIDCENLGSNLVDITSSEEDALVRSLVLAEGAGGDYWIGLGEKDTLNFHWMDGSPTTFEHWAEIGGKSSGSDCIRSAADLFWNDMNCDGVVKYGYICEGKTTDHLCAVYRLYTFQSSCYTKSNTLVFRDEAKEICELAGGHLVYVETEAEHNYLNVSGLSSSDGGQYWIGLTQRAPGSDRADFIWISGAPLVYSNFGDLTIGSDCVLIQASDGYSSWNDEICYEGHPFICEYKDEAKYQQLPFVLKKRDSVPNRDDIIDKVTRGSLLKCASLCASTTDCKSLAYNKLKAFCILATSSSAPLTSADGFQYYTRKDD